MSLENSNILIFKAKPTAEMPEASLASVQETPAVVVDLGAYRELGKVATINCDLTSINTLKQRSPNQYDAERQAAMDRHPAGKARKHNN